MNRNSLWTVTVVVAAWIGFLLGYAMSSHSGAALAGGPKAVAGGYGKVPAKGATKQQAPEAKKGPN